MPTLQIGIAKLEVEESFKEDIRVTFGPLDFMTFTVGQGRSAVTRVVSKDTFGNSYSLGKMYGEMVAEYRSLDSVDDSD
jgi:hypothetical protein